MKILFLIFFSTTAFSFNCEQLKSSEKCEEFQKIRNSQVQIEKILEKNEIYSCDDNRALKFESYGSFIWDKLNNTFYEKDSQMFLKSDKSYLKVDEDQNIHIFNFLKERSLVKCIENRDLLHRLKFKSFEFARNNDLVNLYDLIERQKLGKCELRLKKDEQIRILTGKKTKKNVVIKSFQTIKRTKMNLFLENNLILNLDKNNFVLKWDEYNLLSNNVLQNRVITYKKDIRKLHENFGEEKLKIALKLKYLVLKGACYEN